MQYRVPGSKDESGCDNMDACKPIACEGDKAFMDRTDELGTEQQDQPLQKMGHGNF